MKNAWLTVTDIYQANPIGWDVALGATVLMVGLFYARRLFNDNWQQQLWGALSIAPRRRGKAMRRARRDFIRSDTIDALVDHIEKRVAQGDYTRKEANELYREARKAWQTKDLFPNPELLKENIKARRAKHLNEPVPLPDAAPKPARLMFKSKPVVA